MSLVVTHQEVERPDGTLKNGVAWRVAVMLGDHSEAVPVEFAREVDAELACVALQEAGFQTASDLRRAGFAAVRQIMIEALPW